MKKFLILIMIFSISVMSFAQKNELKAASKALDNNQFTEAVSILNGAESLIVNAKTKYQSEYYFLLGKALYANGTQPENSVAAAKALSKAVSLSNTDAKNLLAKLVQGLAQKGSDLYSKGNSYNESGDEDLAKESFLKSADYFKSVYETSPVDTAFYQNAAFVYYRVGEYQKSIDAYQDLLDMGYTGAGTSFMAKSAANGQAINFNSKSEMDKQVKLGLAVEPEVVVNEPQTAELMRMISKGYTGLGNHEKALEVIQNARELNPDDFNLLVDEAYAYYNSGDKNKFTELLEKAISINPNDYVLNYNIGVMKSEMGDIEGAIISYKKALELKPDYTDAYRNLGAVILDKAKPIVEEMNNSLNDFAKYDKLQAKQLEVYKEALPYFEKTYALEPTNPDNLQVLIGIYEQLEMYDQSKALRAKLEELK